MLLTIPGDGMGLGLSCTGRMSSILISSEPDGLFTAIAEGVEGPASAEMLPPLALTAFLCSVVL